MVRAHRPARVDADRVGESDVIEVGRCRRVMLRTGALRVSDCACHLDPRKCKLFIPGRGCRDAGCCRKMSE